MRKDLITGAVLRHRIHWAIISLLLTAAIVTRVRFSPAPRVEYPGWEPFAVENWREYSRVGHSEGPDSAPAILVVFSDFQCPHCRSFWARLDSLKREYPLSVRTVFRHYPLDRHPLAFDAAVVSECAALQGEFASLRDFLFRYQDSLVYFTWPEIVQRSQVADPGQLRRCFAGRTTVERVESDRTDARALGIQATPAVLVNGTFYHIPPSLDEFRNLIDLIRAQTPG